MRASPNRTFESTTLQHTQLPTRGDANNDRRNHSDRSLKEASPRPESQINPLPRDWVLVLERFIKDPNLRDRRKWGILHLCQDALGSFSNRDSLRKTRNVQILDPLFPRNIAHHVRRNVVRLEGWVVVFVQACFLEELGGWGLRRSHCG
jgi:hypothetical protein